MLMCIMCVIMLMGIMCVIILMCCVLSEDILQACGVDLLMCMCVCDDVDGYNFILCLSHSKRLCSILNFMYNLFDEVIYAVWRPH